MGNSIGTFGLNAQFLESNYLSWISNALVMMGLAFTINIFTHGSPYMIIIFAISVAMFLLAQLHYYLNRSLIQEAITSMGRVGIMLDLLWILMNFVLFFCLWVLIDKIIQYYTQPPPSKSNVHPFNLLPLDYHAQQHI